MTEKTYIFDSQDIQVWQKRLTYMTEKTYIFDSKDQTFEIYD